MTANRHAAFGRPSNDARRGHCYVTLLRTPPVGASAKPVAVRCILARREGRRAQINRTDRIERFQWSKSAFIA